MRHHIDFPTFLLGFVVGVFFLHACRAHAEAPDPALSPGASFPHKALCPDERPCVFCVPGYATKIRNVTYARKRAVCRAYGIAKGCPGPGYEVDHLIPLCAGGSNDDKNLWAEPIKDAKVKDALENLVCRRICNGAMTLEAGQRIMMEWR